MTLNQMFERWAFWRITGFVMSKSGELYCERVQSQPVKGVELAKDDILERQIERVFIQDLTDKQRLVLVLEYRAHSDVPYIKGSERKASALGLTHDDYRKTLQRSRNLVSSCVGVI